MRAPDAELPPPRRAAVSEMERLPKVSLHDHLEGALRESTIVEIGTGLGLVLPAEEPQALSAWFAERAHAGSLVAYLESFWITDAIMQTAENLHRVAYEYALDLAADGVVYAEVRWAPEAKLRGGMTLDEAVETVQAGLEAGVSEARKAGRDLVVNQLLCAMRNGPHAPAIADLSLRHRERGVVGFDIAGPERGFAPSMHKEAFDLLARNLMPVTVHAGEADGIDSIASALVDGRALRLGHGVRIIEDVSVTDAGVVTGHVASWVRDRGIILETSPTSNLHTGAYPNSEGGLAAHPFEMLRRAGFAVTVNTDNRLMSQTTLSAELAKLADAFGYGHDDLLTFQLTAAAGAFVDQDARRALAAKIRAGFDRVNGGADSGLRRRDYASGHTG